MNDELIDKTMSKFGYFTLVSNYVSDPVKALTIYIDENLLDKAFYSVENRPNLTSIDTYSTDNLEGLIFTKFVALILTSYIHKQIKTSSLYHECTIFELLTELDIISLYKDSNNKSYFGEITSKQLDIYKLFDITLKHPDSLYLCK
jgi:transposase